MSYMFIFTITLPRLSFNITLCSFCMKLTFFKWTDATRLYPSNVYICPFISFITPVLTAETTCCSSNPYLPKSAISHPSFH